MRCRPVEPFADVLLIETEVHGDERGWLSETYHRERFARMGLDVTFVQENHACSRRAYTIRGLHYQIPPHAQAKLIRVLKGAIVDVVVDIRRGSPTFGRHAAVRLQAGDWRQLYVPEGFAHGYCTLEPDTEVLYRLSGHYAPTHERGIAWDDPDLSIAWPLPEGVTPLISPKDRRQPRLREQPDLF